MAAVGKRITPGHRGAGAGHPPPVGGVSECRRTIWRFSIKPIGAWQRYSGRAMSFSDAIGFVAAALVLVTFYQRQMIPLRLAALGSNLAFIVYGLALGLAPVWLLHALLLPVNASRLAEALRAKHSLDGSPR